MKTKLYIVLVWAGMLLGACQEEGTSGMEAGREVSLRLSVQTVPMEAADKKAGTRSAMSTAEATIKSLYLVQFDGTATGSKVVKSGSIVRNADQTAMFDFQAVNATCRVYVVANFNPNAANGTTLFDFEQSMATYLPTTSLPVGGLPMCGSVDFNPATAVNTPQVSLKSMLAKLTVTYTLAPEAISAFKTGTTALSLVLKNVPNGTAFKPTTNPSTPYQPANITYANHTVGTTGVTYTYYVPENIAGNSSESITTWQQRSKKKAPAKALYFELKGRNVTDDCDIIIASYIGDPGTPNNFNIYRNYAYTLNATIKSITYTDERITLKPDYLDLNVGVGNKTANCYVITQNGSKWYAFDATKRGNNDPSITGISYSTLPDLGTATEARVLWQTNGRTSVIKELYYEDGKVIFNTGTATEGNAVIGLFSHDHPAALCLWSWHIWKVNGSLPADVDCGKTPSPSTASPTFKMMGLNLGAYNNTKGSVGAIGLLYQWGRKDPFPGPAGFNTTGESTNIYGDFVGYGGFYISLDGPIGAWNEGWAVSSSNVKSGTELSVVQYPAGWIYGRDNTTYDWMNIQSDELWGTSWNATGSVNGYNANQGKKTIYDPCPVGYRVPPHDAFTKASATSWVNDGVILGNMANGFWFPVAARRLPHSGNLSVTTCCYWTSSPNDTKARWYGGVLRISYGSYTEPDAYENRSVGGYIRCVKE